MQFNMMNLVIELLDSLIHNKKEKNILVSQDKIKLIEQCFDTLIEMI